MLEMLLSSGVGIRIKEVSNLRIWHQLSKAPLALPLPPLYELDDGREVEHTQSEVYQHALVIYDILRSEYAFMSLLESAVEFDERLMLSKEWKATWKYLQADKVMRVGTDERAAFLQFYAIQGAQEKFDITRKAILNEFDVYDIFNSIQISRDGYDIHKVRLRNSFNAGVVIESLSIEGVQLINPLDEATACKEFHLSWLDWTSCVYSNNFKANVVAMQRLERIVSSHQSDAEQIHSEKKSKAK